MTRMYSVDPHKPSAYVHWDWLTAVIPIPEFEDQRSGESCGAWTYDVVSELGLDYTWMQMDHGLYTYKNAVVSADASIIVAWNDDAGISATMMIQLSGAGVESAESILKRNNRVIADFICDVINVYHGWFSRIDACCNFFNYSKEYSARYAGEEALAGHLVTRSSRIKLIRSASSQGGQDDDDAYLGVREGYTTYIGSNPKQLRIYNKLAERSDKVNQRFQVDSWSRWEFQLNGEQAQQFVDAFLDSECDLPTVWTTWLASNYRFIEEVGHQEKRSRYPNASWFDVIIKNRNGEIKVRSEKQAPTLERSQMWIDNQVMPTIATMFYARYKKYIINGVSEEDAKKLALKFITRGIDEKLVNDEINMTKVDAWIQEQEE